MPTTGTLVVVAWVMVITLVATVQVIAEPSERFSSAAPLMVVRSLRVIVSSVLTVASMVTTCFVLAASDDCLPVRCDGFCSIYSCHFLLFLLTVFVKPAWRTESSHDREYA